MIRALARAAAAAALSLFLAAAPSLAADVKPIVNDTGKLRPVHAGETVGVDHGGTGAATLTAHGVVLGNGTTAVNVTAAGTSGKPLVSGGASADPSYATLGVSGGGTNCAVASGTCLDNIAGFGSLGFLQRTGAGTYSFVSATNGLTLGNLPQISANRLLGNVTASTANVAEVPLTNCNGAAKAVTYTNGSGFGCNTITATGGGAGVYEATCATPVSGSFAWVNQGDATATNGTGALILAAPANASINWRILKSTAPATPYDVYLRIWPVELAKASAMRWGIILRNSSSGKFVSYVMAHNGTDEFINSERWTSATVFSATSGIGNSAALVPPGPYWLRVNVTSTTITAYSSSNGWDWYQHPNTETLASFLTSADEFGFGVRVDNGSSVYSIACATTTAPT